VALSPVFVAAGAVSAERYARSAGWPDQTPPARTLCDRFVEHVDVVAGCQGIQQHSQNSLRVDTLHPLESVLIVGEENGLIRLRAVCDARYGLLPAGSRWLLRIPDRPAGTGEDVNTTGAHFTGEGPTMESTFVQSIFARPRRDGRRCLCAAEGVLVALRGYSLDEAFADILQTAGSHNIAPLSLTDALVAIAQGCPTGNLDRRAVGAVEHAWGELLKKPNLSGF
jgi:hypothetical protein